MARFWWLLLLAAATPTLFGQSTELERLVAESEHIRALIKTEGEVTPSEWADLKKVLRDWIELRLPSNLAELNAQFPSREARLTADLRRAGLLERQRSTADFGNIASLKFSRPDSYPGGLMIQAGVTAGCGTDVSLYLYHFTTTSRTRVLEAKGTHKWGSEFMEAQFSALDSSGSRVFYASWYAVQCGSVWEDVDYRLFRIDRNGNRALPLFSGTHSFIRDSVHVKLTPEELLLEMTAEGMEGGEPRTHVLHYRIGREGVERIDPVALQPEDFVHEWLTRPWDEMISRSSEAVAKWHSFLHADLVFGEYVLAQPCEHRAGFTQVVAKVADVGEREFPEPLAVSFLVRDNGDHHYQMSEISFTRQAGCSN